MAYCDYDFYTTKYMGNVIAEVDFPRLSERASDKLDMLTFNRLSSDAEGKIYTLYERELEHYELEEKTAIKVKKAVCALAEILNDIEMYEKSSRGSIGFEETENGLKGKVISSISSGSESISYSVKTDSASSLVGAVLTDKNAQNRLFYDTVKEYLSGTGLLYAGI